MDKQIHGRNKWAQFDDSICPQPSLQNTIPFTEDLFKDLSHPDRVGSHTCDDPSASFSFMHTAAAQPVQLNPTNPILRMLPDAHQTHQIPGSGSVGIEQGTVTSARSNFKPPKSTAYGLPCATATAASVAPRTDVWNISSEQRAYYLSQFLRLQSDPRAKLSGLQAKMFFELSKLPTNELSDIWEMSDVDRDGELTLNEFVVAMHLVVLRRNGVPVPRILPDTLMEVVTSQSLSTLVPSGGPNAPPCLFDPLESTPSTVDCQDTSFHIAGANPTTNIHHPWHGSPPSTTTCSSVAQTPVCSRQRRWSISSQSDISSLAEGIMHFEAKPNANGHLQHPIPVRARTLPMGYSETDTNATTQRYPFDETPLRMFTAPPSDSLVSSSPEHMEHPIATKIAASIASHMPKSTPPPLPPPPPPPRAHVAGRRQTAGGDELQQQPMATDYRGSETDIDAPWLDVRLCTATENKSDHIDSDSYINLNRLTDLIHSKGSEAVIAQLQQACDEITQTNDELASELMQLQQHRIALKILLERLMPLETASYPG